MVRGVDGSSRSRQQGIWERATSRWREAPTAPVAWSSPAGRAGRPSSVAGRRDASRVGARRRRGGSGDSPLRAGLAGSVQPGLAPLQARVAAHRASGRQGLACFAAATPTGLALRALGKDPLRLRRDPDAGSRTGSDAEPVPSRHASCAGLLADARTPALRRTLNLQVKHREPLFALRAEPSSARPRTPAAGSWARASPASLAAMASCAKRRRTRRSSAPGPTRSRRIDRPGAWVPIAQPGMNTATERGKALADTHG